MNPTNFPKIFGFSQDDENGANGIQKVSAGRDILETIHPYRIRALNPGSQRPFYSHE
jgi:hypothetical protein